MKITHKYFIYIPAVAIIIIIGLIYILLIKSTSYEGKIYAAIDSEIIIERDQNGIPFVKAGSLNDAYFAVGFLHGRDRLPLLEYFRAIAGGRLTGLIGSRGHLLDKLSLTIGFARKAETIVTRLKGPYIEYFDSYIKGINEAKKEINISGLSKGISSLDWTVKDAVSILLMYEWCDSFLNNKKLIFPLLNKFDPRMLRDIIPEDFIYRYSDEEKNLISLLLKIRNEIRERVGQFQSGFAFYISGENMGDGKSVSGFTLDGEMSVYPKWYPVSITISSGDNINKKIEGVTASGLPFIFFGRNRDISFFGFNMNVETQNFYVEKTRFANRVQQYYRNGIWKDFAVVNENIFTNSEKRNAHELRYPVRASDIGPVISDLSEKDDEYLCISINSLYPDESYIKTLFDIPLSDSIVKAKNAVRYIHSLPKQYLFTSNEDATCVYSGRIFQKNLKKIFINSSVFSDVIVDLSAYTTKSIVSNVIIGSKIFNEIPGVITDRAISDVNRYLRFKFLIEREDFLYPKDIAASLKDTHSTIAERFVPVFMPVLEQFPIPSAKLTRIYFSNWNYNMDTESVAATIFNTILINMIEETVNDEMGNSTSILMENYDYLVDKFYDMILQGNSKLFDDIGTKDSVENRDNIFDRAFLKTLKLLNRERGPEMENWKWGAVHKRRLNIPLRRQSFFSKRMEKFTDVGIAGGNSTVMKGGVSAVNLLAPANISVLSGIFYLDLQLSFFSLPVPQSLDPDSEYSGNFNNSSEFIEIDAEETIHKLVLLPLKTKSD